MLIFVAFLAMSNATIHVDVSKSIGPVNRMVLGSNLVDYQKGGYGDTSPSSTNEGMGMWDPVKQEPVSAMVALAREAGMSMTRWPGGCATHLYEWKRTIGPLSSRPDQLFGLPEYLTTCKAIGAEPLITVAEYFGTPQDAADMVEYLNAPNDGKHPWAAKRAADGHASPWKVTWFEFGNESDHGPHRNNDDMGKVRAPYSSDEYGDQYLAYQRAMRHIDANIKLGAVVSTGLQKLDGWPSKVAGKIGSAMDFAIFHSYLPSIWQTVPPPSDSLIPDTLAGEDQIQNYVDALRAMLGRATGRPTQGPQSTPIAVTEFNGGFVQDKPVPYRHSLGNALNVSDMIHVWLRPKNGIAFANFWEFPNEYWGMVRGYANHSQPLVRRPQFYAPQLFAQHFGSQMLNAKVTCPSYSTPGNEAIGIERHSGTGSVGADLESSHITPAWKITTVKSVVQKTEEGVLEVQFREPGDINYYHAVVEVPAVAGATYRLTGWVKAEGMPAGNGAAFQIGDARGWPTTHSAQVTPSISGTTGWKQVEIVYTALPDTKALQIVARRLEGTGPVRGTAWYKNLTLTRMIPKSLPSVPVLTVSASRDASGHRVFLIVTNKDLHNAVSTKLLMDGFVTTKVRAWSLTGPSADSTNEDDPQKVGVHEIAVSGQAIQLPACSLTAIEVEGHLAIAK